jgi:apolipoprotein N-acyltransferase
MLNKAFYLFFILSFFVVAFSEGNFLGILTGFLGYALFWKAMLFLKGKKSRFWLSVFWFFLVQGVWLFWMTSTEYVGDLVLVVYFSLILLWGVQFGFLSLMIGEIKKLKTFKIFFIAATWTIFEWVRLFLLCGFTWNPVGLALTNNHFSMQLASLFGVYGLSFYVILSNLFFLKSFVLKKVSIFLIFLICFPYLFGFIHEKVQKKFFKSNERLSVLLVQTGVTPSEKNPMFGRGDDFIFPEHQWRRILSFLKKEDKRKINLIVLPEAALPFGAFKFFYDYDTFLDVWKGFFGEGGIGCLPVLKEPFARKNKVSNAYFAQAIANYFKSEVVIGLDDEDRSLKKSYNAAFHFLPNGNSAKRYEKQVLVPISEYFPFSWCLGVAKRYGIGEIFTPGKGVKIFEGKVPFSISICYEETYGDLMRLRRKGGAKLFINITNDAWFPKSKLPKKHFDLGIVRSVENGIPIIRACNTGVTGGVDCFGRVLGRLEVKNILPERVAGALYVDLPLNNYLTLYTFWGDKFIVVISFLILFLGIFFNKNKMFIRKG